MKYDWRDAPRGVLLWACAYSTNNTEKGMGLKREPVVGIIVAKGNLYDDIFYEVNKKSEIIQSRYVKSHSRKYADTKEESVEIYNEQVVQQIKFLEGLIEDCKSDLIK